MMMTLLIICCVLATIPFLMFLWNMFLFRPLPAADRNETGAQKAISVLIPARNEERSIRDAINAVLANKGVEFEVIVLDDDSTDSTPKIVEELSAWNDRVFLIEGPLLPEGWSGKQHACYHLAKRARFPLLLFIDADVRLEPDSLARISAYMTSTGLPLLSVVPRQVTVTVAEQILIPLIHFLLLGFLPMKMMWSSRKPRYGAGCGQLMIARADDYWKVGGHSSIRHSFHDGLKLPRAFRKAGLLTGVLDGTDLAVCRMYRNAREVRCGLSKNAVEGMAAPKLIGVWTFLLFLGHIMPWLLLPISWLHSRDALILNLIAIFCSLAPRFISVIRFKCTWLSAFAHPFGVAVMLIIQWNALIRLLLNEPVSWKGRVQPPAMNTVADTGKIQRKQTSCFGNSSS